MNRTFLLGAIFVAATFLITNTPNTIMAYSCSSSSSTAHTSIQTGVSDQSGSCSTSSGASTMTFPSNQNTGSATGNELMAIAGISIAEKPPTLELGTSAGAGGGQSSCSSSFAASGNGLVISSSSTSKTGSCP